MKQEHKKLLELALKRFKASSDYWDEIKICCADDEKFALGDSENEHQWQSAQKQSQSVRVTINRLPQHLAQVVNEQRQNRPAIKVRPVDDKGDIEVAKVYDGLIRHIQNNTNECYEGADLALTEACNHQVAGGIGYFEICSDYYDEESGQQDLYFRRIPDPQVIYDDPAIRTVTGRDRRYLFETYVMPEEEFSAEFPEAEKIDWQMVRADKDVLDWFTETKGVRVAKYWVREYETQEKGKRKQKVPKVRCYTINGNEVLETAEWVGQYIPWVRIVGNHAIVDGKPVISGLVRNAKDAQRLYNYWASREAEILSTAPLAPFVGAAEAFAGYEDLWNRANTDNVPWLPYQHRDKDGQPLPPPQRMQPTLPQAGFLQAKLNAADDIKATTGQYDASLGARSNETSGVAIRQRQHEGDLATFHYLDNLAFGLKFAGEIIIDAIPKIYDTPRIARILGEDDSPDYAELDPEQEDALTEQDTEEGGKKKIYNLGVGKYDVQITVGPSYTTKRQESLEFLTQLNQSNPQVAAATGDLMIKLADVPHGDEMAERVKALLPPPVQQVLQSKLAESGLSPDAVQIKTEAKQSIAMLQGQMQAMQEALQQKSMEAAQLDAQLKDKSADIASRERIAMQNNEAKMQIESMRGEIKLMEQRMEMMQQVATQAQQARLEQPMPQQPQSPPLTVIDGSGNAVQTSMQTMAGIQAQLEQQGAMFAQALQAIAQSNAQMMQAIAQLAANKPDRVVEMVGPSGNVYKARIGDAPQTVQ